jgi:hypothetical protein
VEQVEQVQQIVFQDHQQLMVEVEADQVTLVVEQVEQEVVEQDLMDH